VIVGDYEETLHNFQTSINYVVEPACRPINTAEYENLIESSLRESGLELKEGPVVVVVCEGSDATPQRLTELAQQLGLL